MISLAIKYLTFHGYLVKSPKEQAEETIKGLEAQLEEPPEEFGADSEQLIYDYQSSCMADAYQEGFWDGQQVGN